MLSRGCWGWLVGAAELWLYWLLMLTPPALLHCGHQLPPGLLKLDFPAHWWCWRHTGDQGTNLVITGQLHASEISWTAWTGSTVSQMCWEASTPRASQSYGCFESLILPMENGIWTCLVIFFSSLPLELPCRYEISKIWDMTCRYDICCMMHWLQFEVRMNYKKLCY